MTVLADAPSRPRKRTKPSFDAPADVTSSGESGWVFRSDVPDATSVEPAPVAIPDVAPPVRAAAAPASPPPPEIAPAAQSRPEHDPAPQAVVMAPVIASESPLRFAWVPLAIGYTTILAMLPRSRRRDGGDR